MNPKNILFIIPEMSMGGAQRSLTKLSMELGKLNSIWVVVFNRSHAVAANHSEHLLSLDVESGSGLFLKFIAFVKRIIALRKLKNELKIDVAISFLEGADYINILSKGKERVIISIRGSKVFDENMIGRNFVLRRWLLRNLYKRADEIVCVNRGIKNELMNYYHIKASIHVIHNFYNLIEIKGKASIQLPDNMMRLFNIPVIAMSGRLAVEKGHALIISVFSQLKKKNVSVRLLLIGDGPERNKLIDLCESLHLTVEFKVLKSTTPDVFITGELENVFNILSQSSVYLLNSSSEGFPNGLAEAMACGIPVVSSDCPYGPREILSLSRLNKPIAKPEFAEYGILVPMHGLYNPEKSQVAWIDVIEQLLSSVELREKYGKLGSLRIREFSKDAVLKQWGALFEA